MTANGYAPFCRGWDVDVIKLIWLHFQKLVNFVKEKKKHSIVHFKMENCICE